MKTVEEILAQEQQLLDDKKNHRCLCYAVTRKVCTICQVHMDLDTYGIYASCDPTCKIACLTKSQLIELSHENDPKRGGIGKGMKFVTFTRPGKEETDHLQLFKVLNYIKKAKAIKQFWYAFEYQENGNPHLHCVIHMNEGYYFRDIARMLIKNNVGGYMDEQNQRGTQEEALKYLYKDIDKTCTIMHNLPKNYFLLNNIKPSSKY